MRQVFRRNTQFRSFRVRLSPDAPVGSKVTVDGGSKYWIDDSKRIISVCQKIIDEYQAQNITMTLRQLYYQLVSADEIPNTDVAYKKVSEIVKESRYAGLLDWDGIEDRGRQPVTPLEFDSIKERIDLAIRNFRLPRWADQEYYLELFSEKDALSSVLMPIANQYHITYCFNKGYSSASAYYDLQNRVRDKLKAGKKVVLLYLGDHDSSGVDMLRDIKDRITEFLTEGDEYISPDFDVVPVALTWEQIKKYNPPPNPTKLTDPRAGKYIAKYGHTTWEVDALKPDVMIKIVETAIRKYIDIDKYNAVIEREDNEKQKLVDFAKKIVPKKVVKEGKMVLGDDRSKIFVLSQDISSYEYDKETADERGVDKGSVDYFCPICGDYYENDYCKGKQYALDNLWEHIKEHSQEQFDEWKKDLGD